MVIRHQATGIHQMQINKRIRVGDVSPPLQDLDKSAHEAKNEVIRRERWHITGACANTWRHWIRLVS